MRLSLAVSLTATTLDLSSPRNRSASLVRMWATGLTPADALDDVPSV
jgi:hypothetical protein